MRLCCVSTIFYSANSFLGVSDKSRYICGWIIFYNYSEILLTMESKHIVIMWYLKLLDLFMVRVIKIWDTIKWAETRTKSCPGLGGLFYHPPSTTTPPPSSVHDSGVQGVSSNKDASRDRWINVRLSSATMAQHCLSLHSVTLLVMSTCVQAGDWTRNMSQLSGADHWTMPIHTHTHTLPAWPSHK